MYRELAEHYDRIYAAKDYAAESARVQQIIAEFNPEARSLLDVACGTGGHLAHLLRHFECEGLDLSPEMVALARKKLPRTKIHVASMTGFKLERNFDAVVSLFSAVGHLVTVDRLNSAVSSMADHLNSPGVLIVEPWIKPEDWVPGRLGLDTYDGEDLKIARLTLSEPVDRGRIVMEYLIGTKSGVRRLRDDHEMGWFTHSEYQSAFAHANLGVRFDPIGLTGRGLYIGTTPETA